MNDAFKGFVWPKENWFRIPNEWTNITHGIKSLAELKVIEYVLRHTWGYRGQHDKPKRISIDEFAHGRKRRNGSRIDKGIGLSRPSIRQGILLAIEHGYLELAAENVSDKARIKRWYKLNMIIDSPHTRDKESLPLKKECLSRTKKDNTRKTILLKEEKTSLSDPTGSDGEDASAASRRKKMPSKFDHRAAVELHKAISSHIKVNCRSDLNQWAEQLRLLREYDKVPQNEIKRTIQWYGRHIDDEFAIEAYSGKAFREKFKRGQFAGAIKRSGERDSPSFNTESSSLVGRVQGWLAEHREYDITLPTFDEDIQAAVDALGIDGKAFDWRDV